MVFLASCLVITWAFQIPGTWAQVSHRQTHVHIHIWTLEKQRELFEVTFVTGVHRESRSELKIAAELLVSLRQIYLAAPQSSYFMKWGQSIPPVEVLCPSCDGRARTLPQPLQAALGVLSGEAGAASLEPSVLFPMRIGHSPSSTCSHDTGLGTRRGQVAGAAETVLTGQHFGGSHW